MASTNKENSDTGTTTPKRRKRRRAPDAHVCPICGQKQRFFRTCPCGFEMCQDCMDENLWGVTCNHITWVCPDCGEANSY